MFYWNLDVHSASKEDKSFTYNSVCYIFYFNLLFKKGRVLSLCLCIKILGWTIYGGLYPTSDRPPVMRCLALLTYDLNYSQMGVDRQAASFCWRSELTQHWLRGQLLCILQTLSTKVFGESSDAHQLWATPYVKCCRMHGLRNNIKTEFLVLSERTSMSPNNTEHWGVRVTLHRITACKSKIKAMFVVFLLLNCFYR